MLAGPDMCGCAKVLASESWKVAYGLMSSEDSVNGIVFEVRIHQFRITFEVYSFLKLLWLNLP